VEGEGEAVDGELVAEEEDDGELVVDDDGDGVEDDGAEEED